MLREMLYDITLVELAPVDLMLAERHDHVK